MLPPNITAETSQRVFVDASYTLSSGRNSGIERVVRNLSHHCSRLSADQQFGTFAQVISSGREFVSLSESLCDQLADFGDIKGDVLRGKSSSYKSLATRACRLVRSKSLEKWLLPKPGHLGIFKVPYRIREKQLQKSIAAKAIPVEPQPGDLFLLPDAYWVNRLRNTVWPAAAKARAAGARVACVIYDLIPLTHPQFVGSERSSAFKRYLIDCARNSDLLLTISKTVGDELATFIDQQNDPSLCDLIQPFELGCELTSRDGNVRKEVTQAFSGKRPYLTVATFDPRKNHAFLLDAFERMWRKGSKEKLVLVGRLGSRCDATVRRALQHAELGNKLFVFNDLADAELQYCYRESGGVIFPSIVEGFGLPIVEALWFGQKTFASDTKIHREVGQGDCTYFKLDDCGNLIDALEDWGRQVARGAEPPQTPRQLTSWEMCTRQVLEHCGVLRVDNSTPRVAA